MDLNTPAGFSTAVVISNPTHDEAIEIFNSFSFNNNFLDHIFLVIGDLCHGRFLHGFFSGCLDSKQKKQATANTGRVQTILLSLRSTRQAAMSGKYTIMDGKIKSATENSQSFAGEFFSVKRC